MSDEIRCEGYIKKGSFMTFGPRQWEQCKNDAVVKVTSIQDGEETTVPVCIDCWKLGISHKIEITKVVPI